MLELFGLNYTWVDMLKLATSALPIRKHQKGSDRPDLQTQLESLLDQVWKCEADWRRLSRGGGLPELDLAKVAKGQLLSPVLLVRGRLTAHVPLTVADGYHRICPSYHLDEKADIPCLIVRRKLNELSMAPEGFLEPFRDNRRHDLGVEEQGVGPAPI